MFVDSSRVFGPAQGANPSPGACKDLSCGGAPGFSEHKQSAIVTGKMEAMGNHQSISAGVDDVGWQPPPFVAHIE